MRTPPPSPTYAFLWHVRRTAKLPYKLSPVSPSLTLPHTSAPRSHFRRVILSLAKDPRPPQLARAFHPSIPESTSQGCPNQRRSCRSIPRSNEKRGWPTYARFWHVWGTAKLAPPAFSRITLPHVSPHLRRSLPLWMGHPEPREGSSTHQFDCAFQTHSTQTQLRVPVRANHPNRLLPKIAGIDPFRECSAFMGANSWP